MSRGIQFARTRQAACFPRRRQPPLSWRQRQRRSGEPAAPSSGIWPLPYNLVALSQLVYLIHACRYRRPAYRAVALRRAAQRAQGARSTFCSSDHEASLASIQSVTRSTPQLCSPMDVTLTPSGELYSRDFRAAGEAARAGSTIKLLQVIEAGHASLLTQRDPSRGTNPSRRRPPPAATASAAHFGLLLRLLLPLDCSGTSSGATS